MLGKRLKQEITSVTGHEISRFGDLGLKYKIANDEILCLDFTKDMEQNHLVNGLAVCLYSIIIFLLSYNYTTIIWWICIITLFFFGISLIILHFNFPPYHIKLDRIDQEITYPFTLLRLKKKIKFKDLKIKRFRLIDTEGNPGPDFCYISIVNSGMFFRTKIYKTVEYPRHESHLSNVWSFYVWYMDKNQRLPPDKVFDPYRERDYKRRKAEGFPRPLYSGSIFKEATKEQQKEREAIGGW